jgi:hypothetical protein
MNAMITARTLLEHCPGQAGIHIGNNVPYKEMQQLAHMFRHANMNQILNVGNVLKLFALLFLDRGRSAPVRAALVLDCLVTCCLLHHARQALDWLVHTQLAARSKHRLPAFSMCACPAVVCLRDYPSFGQPNRSGVITQTTYATLWSA